MIPGLYNIQAYRNDTLVKTITITDGNGSPISLATAAVMIQVRTKPDGDVLMTFSEGDGLTVGGAGNNVISVSKIIDINDCGSYYYDLQATFAGGIVSTYIKGAFNVIKDITI